MASMETCPPLPRVSKAAGDANFKLLMDFEAESSLRNILHGALSVDDSAANNCGVLLVVEDEKRPRIKAEGSKIEHRATEQGVGFNGSHGELVKDEREKDRIFWETCLASGYP